MRAGILLLFLLLVACSSPAPYRYRYVPGKTALLTPNGSAVAPPNAPPAVQEAIAAGNRITGSPYVYGGGHCAGGFSKGYDCSGAASFLLSAANLLDSPIPSKEFRKFGEGGLGEWISVYARKDHVFLVVAGLRFDTGWTHGVSGPQWTTLSRPADGCVIRHPMAL